MADYDALVLGAGPNGLATAGMLAKEGYKTVLVEKNDHVGGLASNSYFWPGYTHNTGAWWLSVDKIKPVWDALELDKYCPKVFNTPGMGTTLGLTPDDPPDHMIFDPKVSIETLTRNLLFTENSMILAIMGLAALS